jgi:hypothetical protein
VRRSAILLAAALALGTLGCSEEDGSGETFSWTVHDSMSWGTCVEGSLGAKPRTEASVRTAGESCARYLRPDVSAKASSFGSCATTTYEKDSSAKGLVFALELEQCFTTGQRQGL